ncbi:MAG TPA: hypothetical protein VF170_13715 [Planctomycetaceae bacterium]
MKRTLLSIAALLLSGTAAAEDVKIVLWNGEELFDLDRVNARRADIEAFAGATRPDILLIDEVCSLAVVDEVRRIVEAAVGAEGGTYHAYCSDFTQRDDQRHGSFEVGIVSRFRADQVVEFDVQTDNKLYGRDGEPEEVRLDPSSLLKLGLRRAGSERGFLWARFDDLKLTVCVAHLKSSQGAGGEADYENSLKREFIAAAMALSVLNDKELFPDYSMAVIGDLNVGATDSAKNGGDLDVDSFEAGEGDLYDDTHALLGGGLVAGLRMTNLTEGVGETYFDPQGRFEGTGPIDNIYVTGAGEGRFATAEKGTDRFNSDHFPVWTVYEAP